MAAESFHECNTILVEFLGEKTVEKVNKKCDDNFKKWQYLKNVFDIICERLPPKIGQENDVDTGYGERTFNLIEFASRISDMFSSRIVFQTAKMYTKNPESTGKYSQCLKVFSIITEIIKSCSYEWLIGVKAAEKESPETLDLEGSTNDIIEFLNSLLNLIDLMTLNDEQLKGHEKFELYPAMLQLCHLILEKICEISQTEIQRNLKLNILRKVADKLMLSCLQQIGNQNWIVDSCKKIAMQVLDFLTLVCGSCNLADMLSGNHSKSPENGSIFPTGRLCNVLENIKNFMTNHKLPDFPVATHVLVWSITKVRHPYLKEHISMVIPPLLLLVDDYRINNCVTGIQTLTHVIKNTNAAELRWYGRADIIYDAVHHRLHTNEPKVMQVLQPCLLKIIQVVEPNLKQKIGYSEMNKCDINFQIILTSMEYESKIIMRRAYCSNLALFINHMGIRIVKHFKRLLRVVYGYLEIGDGVTEESRIIMLDILKCIIHNAWARIAIHSNDMLKCLMKLIIDVSFSSEASLEVKDLMFMKVEECIVMLLCVCGEPVKRQLECMKSGLGNKEAEKLISSSLSSCEQM